MRAPEELLQTRLERLEAGKPLGACLAGLPEDEADLLTLAARLGEVQYPVRAWLYRVAHNLIVDHFRKENSYILVSLDHAEGLHGESDNPASIVERRLTLEQARRALAGLDPSQQEVVMLRFLVGLPLREVALALGKTVVTVKLLQHRGLMILRTALSHPYEGCE